MATELLAPMDALRSAVLRPWGTSLRPLLLSRDRRVTLAGAFGITLAFAVACGLPLWSLALGPVLLGVPHLLADVRYLVVRPKLHLRPGLIFFAGIPLALAAIEPRVEFGVLAAIGAVGCADATLTRRAPLLAALIAVFAIAWREGFTAQLVFLHLHNVLAIGLWWFWRKRSPRAWVIPAMAIAGTFALLAGAAEPVLPFTYGWKGPAATFADELDVYAPLANPVFAFRLLVAFVFLQAVHYLVWLRLVPEDDRTRSAPRTFAASFEALRADFGIVALGITAAAALGIAVWGAFDLSAARDGYLRLAGFHGYLELAVAALWLAEGKRG